MAAQPPVASRTTIRALRGLALGTSCSLLLLAEERQQRVQIARKAVNNARQLRGLKSSTGFSAAVTFHGAETAEAGLDPALLEIMSRDQERMRKRRGRSKRRPIAAIAVGSELGDIGLDSGLDLAHLDIAAPFVLPARPALESKLERDSRSRYQREAIRLATRSLQERPTPTQPSPGRNLHANVLDLKGLLEQGPIQNGLDWEESIQALGPSYDKYVECLPSPDEAVELCRRAFWSATSVQSKRPPAVTFSRHLGLAYLREGNADVAAKILGTGLAFDWVEDADYVSYQPAAIIESLLLEGTTGPGIPAEAIESLKLATAIFCPQRFQGVEPSDSVLSTGKTLVESALRLKDMPSLNRIAQQMSQVEDGTVLDEFVLWVLKRLQQDDLHIPTIDCFLSFYIDRRPLRKSFKEVSEIVVKSVCTSNGHRARSTVIALVNAAKDVDATIKSSWLVDLLLCLQSRLNNYPQTRELIDGMIAMDAFRLVDDPRDLRFAIVDIALEQRDLLLAKSQIAVVFAKEPSLPSDLTYQGKFALWKAKTDNWAGLRRDFSQMKSRGMVGSDEYTQTFEACLKEYVRKHTWGEVETFLEDYVTNMDVALNEFMVTLIAERHAKCRDVASLGKWLKFCKQSGFTIDTGLITALFRICEKHWRYNKFYLAPLYRLFKNLGFGFRDRVVETKLNFKYPLAPEAANFSQRIKYFNHILWNHRNGQISLGDEEAAYYRIRSEFMQKNWVAALKHYTDAIDGGMGFTDRTLKLAVRAAIRIDGVSGKRAVDLLKAAHARGHDISNASVPFLIAHLNAVKAAHVNEGLPGYDKSIKHGIECVFNQAKSHGIPVTHPIIVHEAAQACMKGRQYKVAISICESVAQSLGYDDPCCNEQNFADLLYAYRALQMYKEMEWLIRLLPTKEFKDTIVVTKALNRAKHMLRDAAESATSSKKRERHERAYDVVCDALQEVHLSRKGIWAQRQELEKEIWDSLGKESSNPTGVVDSGYESDESLPIVGEARTASQAAGQ
jgi:hypothetical protein